MIIWLCMHVSLSHLKKLFVYFNFKYSTFFNILSRLETLYIILLWCHSWKILFQVFVVIFLPFLLIQKIGFITINTKKMPSQQISPSKSRVANPSKNQDTKLHQNRYVDPGENGNANRIEEKLRWIFTRLYCVYQFYSAPVAKFIVYMVGCFLLLIFLLF